MENPNIFQNYFRRRAKLYTAKMCLPCNMSLLSVDKLTEQYFQFAELLLDPKTDCMAFSRAIKKVPELLYYFTTDMLENVYWMVGQRSGRLLAYVVYRMTLRQPRIFKRVLSFMQTIIQQRDMSLQQVMFIMDLYLYGFTLTLHQVRLYLCRIIQPYSVQLKVYYQPLLQAVQFYSFAAQKHINQCLNTQITQLQAIHTQIYQQLLLIAANLQEACGKQEPTQELQDNYMLTYQQYESIGNRLALIHQQTSTSVHKSITKLKEQCKHYYPLWRKSHLNEQVQRIIMLYSQQKHLKKTMNQMIRSHMMSFEEDKYFQKQLKQCNTIQKVDELCQHFMHHLNGVKSCQQLVQFVLNQCQNLGNIGFIVRILWQLSGIYTSLLQTLQNKVIKMTSCLHLNIKYRNGICEMAKFGLVDPMLIMKYVERIIINRKFKEALQIMDCLGPVVYQYSLTVNIKIDNCFLTIENMMKQQMVGFDINLFMELKSILNHLRRITTCQRYETELIDELHSIQLNQNYDIIAFKCTQILKQGHHQRIIKYLLRQIQHYDYLSTYLYSCLLQTLGDKVLNQMVHKEVIRIIHNSIKSNFQLQKAVTWSRFLGELYNYEVISRKIMINDLYQVLELASHNQNPFYGALKCIAASLETSKAYLRNAQCYRNNNIVLEFLIYLKGSIDHKRVHNHVIEHEIADIMDFFHQGIVKCLYSAQKIEEVKIQYQQIKLAKTTGLNLYTLLDDWQYKTDHKQIEKTGKIKYQSVPNKTQEEMKVKHDKYGTQKQCQPKLLKIITKNRNGEVQTTSKQLTL